MKQNQEQIKMNQENQIIINKFNNILVKSKNNNKNLICYKIIDKKKKTNNKTCDIVSKILFNSN